jgi:sterol 3beta-glucosyltransferase
MTRCVVNAVVDADVYAILSEGEGGDEKGANDEKNQAEGDEKESDGKDGADGVKYPKEIFSIDSIDHSWLFTRIDAACHHGGAGTTGASLRAGIVSLATWYLRIVY